MPHVFDETKKKFVQQHYNDVPLRNSKSVGGGERGEHSLLAWCAVFLLERSEVYSWRVLLRCASNRKAIIVGTPPKSRL